MKCEKLVFEQLRKDLKKCGSYIGTTKAINVKVESKVKEFEIVGDGSKDLELDVLAEFDTVQNGDDGGRSDADDGKNDDKNQNKDQLSLFRIAVRFFSCDPVWWLLPGGGVVRDRCDDANSARHYQIYL